MFLRSDVVLDVFKLKKAVVPMATFMRESRSNAVASQ